MPETVDPFRIRALLPHFESCVADYQASSAASRAELRAQLDVAYGEAPDEKLDLFFPAASASPRRLPIHMFVHGGYWRAFSKRDYSFVADAIVAEGAIAAIIDYSLMPGARMARLVDQVRRAARWLEAHAQDFGGDSQAISASGHSAGGHLVSYLVCRAPHEPAFPDNSVRNILAVSGLYDLAPVAVSFLQPEIQLTQEEIAQWSPCDAIPRGDASVRLLVGEQETAPFFDQARRFSERLTAYGVRSVHATVAGEDHMTIVRALGRPGSACADQLAATIAASQN